MEKNCSVSSTPLYHLIEYTSSPVQELMKNFLLTCHVEGLRDTKCDGQSCQITTTHVNRLVEGPSIRADDGDELQQFHIKLTSYVNTIKKIGYINKQDNLNSLRKVIHRLPSSLINRSKHWQICLSQGQSKWCRT